MASPLPNPLLQAGAIPYRWQDEEPVFCLITTSNGQRWGFPKGIVDPGETLRQTALKEAHEEAGLAGTLDDDPLGQYDYPKWGTQLVVTVFLLHVTEQAGWWEEADVRRRRWASAQEAMQLLDRQALRDLLTAAVERLGSARRQP